MENEACVTLVGPGPVRGERRSRRLRRRHGVRVEHQLGRAHHDVVFKAFSTEAGRDFLTISDGQSGDVLGSFSGEAPCVSTRVSTLRSTR